MKSYRKELHFQIPERRAIVNITMQVQSAINESGIKEGLVLVNAMNITSSVFINDDEPENDSDDEDPEEKILGTMTLVIFRIPTGLRAWVEDVVVDQAELDESHYRLSMIHCVVHNSKGTGVMAVGSTIRLNHCQLTNAGGDCLAVIGGMAEISYCTIAQFYPFDAKRGKALRFANETENPLKRFYCEGLIVTGYADDEVTGEAISDEVDYYFENCLLRTTAEEGYRFEAIIWESPSDEIEGKEHFIKIDEENLIYDFHLNDNSPAKGKGCY